MEPTKKQRETLEDIAALAMGELTNPDYPNNAELTLEEIKRKLQEAEEEEPKP